MEAIEFMDDFFLRSGSKYPTLMEVPFAKHEIQWERSQSEKMYVHGKLNGVQELSVEIDLWKLELPLEGKPKFLVRRVVGSWIELRKPRDFYLETMKVVLVAAYFLIFAKQSPNSSKGDVWRFVRKECREFKAKPNLRDLIQAFLLLQSIVLSDPILQASPIIPQFFPILSKKMKPQAVVQGCGHGRKRMLIQRESSPVSGAEGPTPPAGDDSRGESGSLESMPKTRSLAEFAITEADALPLSTPELTMKKRKVGRPLGSRSGSGRKKEKKSGKGRTAGDDDWVDEPDVCAFCDDGVEQGEKLLCCDGPCMRAFHPTRESGLQNQCPTLGLKREVVSVARWFCPNCEAAQHQCFACGRLGNSSSSSALQEVFVCGAKQCKRFYHPGCVAKLLVPMAPAAEQKHLECSIQLKLDTFKCPLHKCASCLLDEDQTDPDLHLIKCRRCPVAWHDKCLPEACRSQLWPVEGGKYVMYCGQHRLDPELLTPERDHIIFPELKVPGLQSFLNRKPS